MPKESPKKKIQRGVYVIRCKKNGKKYIGGTNNFYVGMQKRRSALNNGVHRNKHLQKDWNRYGEKNFAFEFIESVSGGKEAMQKREQHYFEKWKPAGNLYNIYQRRPGGGKFKYLQGKYHQKKNN